MKYYKCDNKSLNEAEFSASLTFYNGNGIIKKRYRRAGTCDMNKQTVNLEEMMPIIEECLASGGTVSFKPHGTSMLPLLREGRDEVTLAPLPKKLKKYDIVLYKRKNGQYVLHRIVGVKNNYNIIGDNQFKIETVERFQMIGIVIGITRDGKMFKVSSIVYKIYCRFWHYSRFIRRGYHNIVLRIKKLGNR